MFINIINLCNIIQIFVSFPVIEFVGLVIRISVCFGFKHFKPNQMDCWSKLNQTKSNSLVGFG